MFLFKHNAYPNNGNEDWEQDVAINLEARQK